MTADRILVVDNEADIRRFIEVNLRLEGFEVVSAPDGEKGLAAAFEVDPSLVLLDVMMPGIDGIEVCRRLRADPRTSHVPVILLTAKSMTVDKVVGLAAGADDYVLKPFDPMELVARVRTTMRRAADLRGASPLTGLPGNHRIEGEIARRLDQGQDIAVAYVDLNNFKAYNDHYGFLEGDKVIQATAQVLRDVLTGTAYAEAFLGHIGGDDFVMLFDPVQADDVCSESIRRFDEMIPTLYAPEDRERGYLELRDRRGEMRRFGLVSIAIGVTTNAHRTFLDHRDIVAVATEMKTHVKSAHPDTSAYALDGRTG
ncbi:MAG: response regulator [Actinomycetota bacterium]|uniref:GGDEF domain-containing response regulator n=1 Tax=Euzebya pacifica TaxID=1608957 RepID=UPI0030FC48DC